MQLAAHHKMSVKLNENQSVIKKKSNTIFWGKKVNIGLSHPDETLANTKY